MADRGGARVSTCTRIIRHWGGGVKDAKKSCMHFSEERDSLVGHFNSLSSKDAQDSLLAALINVGRVEPKLPIPGVVEEAQNPHDHSYKYHVKVVRSGNAVFIQVCIKAFLYTYDETLANKKSNDEISMISHFIDSYLNPDATELLLFCDSCTGQNKNWTMFRYICHLVHIKKRFTKVMMTFPIKGHSYMECDKDIGLFNQQFRAEVPSYWDQHFEKAQRSPHPSTVIQCDSALFRNLSHHLDPLFLAKCPVASRPFREIKYLKESLSLMKFRESWNGPFVDCVIMKRAKKTKKKPTPNALKKSYVGRLPISEEKFKDLQALRRFCAAAAKHFFDILPHGRGITDDHDEEGAVPLSSLLPGRKRVQICNVSIVVEKSLQHQQDLHHVFIDFKKAFDRVWREALWSTMRNYNINSNLISVKENLYNKATSAVFCNSNIGDWFRTTVGV
ncbi:LOW QUALITY PROTEIN: hypothetical protein PoB_003111000 [Plakobranchus ocellatus]|uniref:DUF7869 domain-containing protein n=1 Tax=Plakobranchus ocellatus TaxID=259542 RepID=A0AAV4ACN0_9GAST|nr:LOW QUALITY PROTEIN: hypothetical protein PoB_003111000 [Plakobranchus ocellatus]